MIAKMVRVLTALALVVVTASCAKPLPDPLLIEGDRLTVSNQTSSDWTDAEIWLNHYYRVKVRALAAGRQTVVPLDAFVDGYGRYFPRGRQMVTDLRLKAKAPDGTAVEVIKQFERRGLDVLRRGES
jgi:hypothetical protein